MSVWTFGTMNTDDGLLQKTARQKLIFTTTRSSPCLPYILENMPQLKLMTAHKICYDKILKFKHLTKQIPQPYAFLYRNTTKILGKCKI